MSSIKVAVVQPPSGSLTFKTGEVACVTILDTGWVGVGITSPTSLFHVAGNVTVDGALTVIGTTSLAGDVTASGLISVSAVPITATTLCNKTYVDGRFPVVPTIYSINNVVPGATTALKTGSLLLTLPAGIWVCECYGMMFVDPFFVYSVSIGGVVVMTTTSTGEQQGASYAPIAGIRKITLTASTAVVFAVSPLDLTNAYDVIFYCKATKVVS